MSARLQITGGEVLVDEGDMSLVSRHTWRLFDNGNGHRYAQTTVRGKTVRMHRLILGLESGDPRMADHIDGNGLNNTRVNLRIVTRTQNVWNSRSRGKYSKGVWKYRNRFCARIREDGVYRFLGTFDTEEQASAAYQAEERRIRGEYGYYSRAK